MLWPMATILISWSTFSSPRRRNLLNPQLRLMSPKMVSTSTDLRLRSIEPRSVCSISDALALNASRAGFTRRTRTASGSFDLKHLFLSGHAGQPSPTYTLVTDSWPSYDLAVFSPRNESVRPPGHAYVSDPSSCSQLAGLIGSSRHFLFLHSRKNSPCFT